MRRMKIDNKLIEDLVEIWSLFRRLLDKGITPAPTPDNLDRVAGYLTLGYCLKSGVEWPGPECEVCGNKVSDMNGKCTICGGRMVLRPEIKEKDYD